MTRILVDRSEELGVLDRLWGRGAPALLVLYGRRRLGKTFLVTSWTLMRNVSFVYIIVNFSDPGPALLDIEEQLKEQLGLRPRIESLRGLVELITRLFCSGRRVIIIDEFQRLAEAGLPQLLQEAWDRVMSSCGAGSVLVLLGSSVGAVERVALHGGAPLYGRATAILRLRPMNFMESYPMLREAPTAEEAFRLYSVFGGTPYYLSLLDPAEGVEGNTWDLVFAPGAPLLDEPLRVLLAEVREPDRYQAIMEAIATGAARLSEIASRTGIAATSLPRYLRVLEEMELVRRVEPLGGGKGVYRILDNFFRFWYRHVAPKLSMLELGRRRAAWRAALSGVERLAAESWEAEALSHFLVTLEERGESPVAAGPWWWKGVEIDALVLTQEALYGIESKWSNLTARDVVRTAARLEAKLEALPARLREGKRLIPVIYARSIKDREDVEGVEVYSLEDVIERGRHTPVHVVRGME